MHNQRASFLSNYHELLRKNPQLIPVWFIRYVLINMEDDEIRYHPLCWPLHIRGYYPIKRITRLRYLSGVRYGAYFVLLSNLMERSSTLL